MASFFKRMELKDCQVTDLRGFGAKRMRNQPEAFWLGVFFFSKLHKAEAMGCQYQDYWNSDVNQYLHNAFY